MEDNVENEVENEDDDDDGEEKSVKFTTFKTREMDCDMGGMKFTLPPGTPCRLTPKSKKKITWSDKMKVQLLKLYMEKATNPLKRPKPSEGMRSRAVYKKDTGVQELYDNCDITLDNGRQVQISSICKPDCIHSHLASGHLTNQQSLGLVKLIDEVMEGEERTMEKLVAKRKDILELAWSYVPEDTESD